MNTPYTGLFRQLCICAFLCFRGACVCCVWFLLYFFRPRLLCFRLRAIEERKGWLDPPTLELYVVITKGWILPQSCSKIFCYSVYWDVESGAQGAEERAEGGGGVLVCLTTHGIDLWDLGFLESRRRGPSEPVHVCLRRPPERNDGDKNKKVTTRVMNTLESYRMRNASKKGGGGASVSWASVAMGTEEGTGRGVKANLHTVCPKPSESETAHECGQNATVARQAGVRGHNCSSGPKSARAALLPQQ